MERTRGRNPGRLDMKEGLETGNKEHWKMGCIRMQKNKLCIG